MRRKNKVIYPGDQRVKSWFAILPVFITKDGVEEMRWLERVTVRQEYTSSWHEAWWCDREFIDGHKAWTEAVIETARHNEEQAEKLKQAKTSMTELSSYLEAKSKNLI